MSLIPRAASIRLSMAERTNSPVNFLDKVFTDLSTLANDSSWHRQDYVDLIAAGSFPGALALADPHARDTWYISYLTTVINQEISNFARIHKASAIPRMLALVAARAGSPFVLSDIAQSAGLSWEVSKNYMSYLDTVFLTITVPAWSSNLTSKITKTPKVFVSDTGLAAHLLQVDQETLSTVGHPLLGNLLETFVATELTKLATFAQRRITLWHFRDRAGTEVDFLLEGPGGAIVGIEVKSNGVSQRQLGKTSAVAQQQTRRSFRWRYHPPPRSGRRLTRRKYLRSTVISSLGQSPAVSQRGRFI